MSLSKPDADYVRDLVYSRSAIHLEQDKDYLIETRLGQLVHTHQIPGGIPEIVARARGGDREMSVQIIEAITTHETSFFRDVAPFDALRTDILPRMIAARQLTRTLTIWSAACSSGQEPYSIGMLLREHFPELDGWRIQIVATDLSRQILEKASSARYSQLEVNRGLPSTHLVKYFERDGTHWKVRNTVRDLVVFRELNLNQEWSFFPRPDIVFIRNVLIYFDIASKRRVLDRIRATLPTDGVLVLGSAETTLNIADGWDRHISGRATYYTVQQ